MVLFFNSKRKIFDQDGACNPSRTGHLLLTRQLLYQMSYAGKVVGVAGFEPTTTCAQGRCATRLRYTPILVVPRGIEPLSAP